MQPAVYILASGRNGTLYTGVTSDLVSRVWQHKHDLAEGLHEDVRRAHARLLRAPRRDDRAITREKQIKKWNRAWKLRLIEGRNPLWEDLYPSIL